MSRTKASLINLLLSSVVFCSVFLVIITTYFPTPFFTLSGGLEGLKIAAAINLTLGPLLTFIVFNKQKSNNKFWGDSFHTVPANALANQNFNLNDFKPANSKGPALIYAKKPSTITGLRDISHRTKIDNIPPHHQVNLYQPLQKYFSKILHLQANISEIVKTNSVMKASLMALLKEKKKNIKDYLYFPLLSKYGNIILVFNHQGKIEGHIMVTARTT